MKSISKLKDEARKHEQREEWEKAIQSYLQVLSAGEEGEGELELPLFNRVGDLYVRLNRSREAVHYYEQAADRYADVGLYNNAIALCNKALRYMPGQVGLLRKLGQFSASQGFLTDARRYLLEYAEKQFATGDIASALHALEEFAEVAEDPEIREGLGRKLHTHGRVAEALTQLKLAFALRRDAGHHEQAEALRREINLIDPSALADVAPASPLDARASAVDPQNTLDVNLGDGLVTNEAEPESASYDIELQGLEPGPPEIEEAAAGGSLVEGFESTNFESPTDLGSGLLEGFETGGEFEPLESHAVEVPDLEVPEPLDPASLPPLDVSDLMAGSGMELATAEPEPAEPSYFDLPLLDESAAADVESEEEGAPLPLLDEDVPADSDDSMLDFDLPLLGPESASEAEPEDNFELPVAEPLAGADPASVEAFANAPPKAEEPPADANLPGLEGPAEELADVAEQAGDPAAHRPDLGDEWSYRAPRAAMDAVEEVELEGGREAEAASPFAGLDAELDDAISDALLADSASLDDLPADRYEAEAGPLPVEEPRPADVEAEETLGWDPSELGPAPPPRGEPAPGRETPKPAGPPPDHDYIDLAALLAEPEKSTDTRFVVQEKPPTGDEDRDFAELLSQFKQKVAEHVSAEDAAAHYDLGLAFKEMGLIDEAIGEFQIALRAGDMRLKVYEELGQCFLQKEQYNIAEKVLRRALESRFDDELELLGVYYHLGRACEGLGKREAARDAYERVLGLDINFGDVSARLARL